MKKWKKLLGLCISFSLLGNIACYALVVVPPLSAQGHEQVGGSSSSGPSTDSASPGGQNQSSGPGGGAVSPGAGSTVVTTTLAQPEVKAQGAALYNVTTGTMIYGKNLGTQFFPASITKLMTALLVLENSNLDDKVTFSSTAVKNLEAGSITINLTEGDQLTVRQCLYAMMLKSANEVANGLAEHVSGSVSAFTDKMNARAKALGCTNTNFANPNGLNNSSNYTTPGDMALIAAEAFKNPALCQVTSALSYQIPATKLVGTRSVTMGHKMLYPSDARYYPGIVGGKTGYTSLAGNTLVTCVEKDGIRLIAVVLKSKQTHYQDTKAMLDYGFAHGGAASGAKWGQDSQGWYFTGQDSSKAQNQWMNIDGRDYWFDSNTYMATGWRQFAQGTWYYLKPSGAMAKNYWIQTDGRWFYLGADGVMLTNTTTPDGFRVDKDGVWVN